jgi:thiol-disulfide isomerase/thioredoxin
MKRSTAYLAILFVLLVLFFTGCNKPVTGNGDANTNAQNGANSSQKQAKVYQDMPPGVMNSEMKTLDGKQFTLKDYQGKIVLVNLWATWCGPCRMEMPELVELQTEYKEKGVVIIGLDTDPEPADMVKTFVEDRQLNYTIGWLSEEAKDGFLSISRQPSIPQSFILTPDGKLAGVFRGFAPRATAEKIRATFNEILSRSSE